MNDERPERSEITEQLRRERELSEKALNHSTDVIFAFDHDLRITVWNAPAERLTGVNKPHAWGRGVATIPRFFALTGGEASYRRVLAGESLRLPEARFFIEVLGVEAVLEVFLTPLRDASGSVEAGLGIIHDITRYKRVEEALQEHEAKLQESNTRLSRTLEELRTAQEQVAQTEKMVALGTMALGVAHELSNPLMGVMGFVGYARRNPGSPSAGEALGKADQELGRMRDLIKSMLGFARPTEGEITDVPLPVLLQHTLSLIGADLKVRRVEVETDLEEGLPPVRANRSQLEQVLLNLLLNARDALDGEPEKRILVRAWSEDAAVVIEVNDTGPGVPETIRERIFEPFFTTKPLGEGTGLGLSVSRTLVTETGGELSLVSAPGEGARFRIRLRKRDKAVSDSYRAEDETAVAKHTRGRSL
ncbi:PAS domain-containing sensor histidine kinase [Thiohalomonas denitrificans]|uniref:histidine kinase n=1 Tax=Thiohalomonas denitrificans TaxID=415747 RepID=A0A1G5PSZ9_9GAMM|nr:ATP-binding protein [Thiohalomonas denitrificans]SCZ52518.1 PAS domain S-box-containing protein [Thiohalomonas denitrificans]